MQVDNILGVRNEDNINSSRLKVFSKNVTPGGGNENINISEGNK